jgi:HEAT repeat protein
MTNDRFALKGREIMRRLTTIALWTAALLLTAAVPLVAEDAKEQEAKLIAVLKSGAGQKEKADACRDLGHVGSAEAVPALVALLDDEKLAHMARTGLETIPGPVVEEALRAALGKLKGLRLAGVIISLGVRHDEKAVEPLTKFLSDADPVVAQAAARALGSIGTVAAGKALESGLAAAPEANKVSFFEGLFRCANALAAKDQRAEAQGIYDRLRTVTEPPHQVRAGALRGAVLMRGTAGVPLLVEALRSEDYILTAAAARTAMELPGPEVTKALTEELPKLPVDKQVLLTQTLATRKDAAAEPALSALAKSGEKPARVAAIRALGQLGAGAAMLKLMELAKDGDKEVSQAAQESLAGLSGPEAEAAIVAMLTQQDPKTRALALEMLSQRRMFSAVPSVLKATEDADESVRAAAIQVLGDLAGAAELPALIGLLQKSKSPAELQAAEGALSALCLRQAKPVPGKVEILKAAYGALPDGPSADVTKQVAEMVKAGTLTVEASNANFGDPANGQVKKLRVDYKVEGIADSKTVNESEIITLSAMASVMPPATVDALCAALAQAATPGAKVAFLRVLRTTGTVKALEAARAAAKDADAQVKDAGISMLCDWPRPDALPDVTELSKTATDAKVKILALRGLIRLTAAQDVAPEKKLAGLKDAMAKVERNEEKKLGLAALGAIPMAEALALVTPHLSNPAVKDEAGLAAVAIGEKLVASNAAAVAAAMDEVVKATQNKAILKRANALQQQAKKK